MRMSKPRNHAEAHRSPAWTTPAERRAAEATDAAWVAQRVGRSTEEITAAFGAPAAARARLAAALRAPAPLLPPLAAEAERAIEARMMNAFLAGPAQRSHRSLRWPRPGRPRELALVAGLAAVLALGFFLFSPGSGIAPPQVATAGAATGTATGTATPVGLATAARTGRLDASDPGDRATAAPQGRAEPRPRAAPALSGRSSPPQSRISRRAYRDGMIIADPTWILAARRVAAGRSPQEGPSPATDAARPDPDWVRGLGLALALRGEPPPRPAPAAMAAGKARLMALAAARRAERSGPSAIAPGAALPA